MSTEPATHKIKNTWIALLVSIVVNGLLLGLLWSNHVKHRSYRANLPQPQNTMKALPNNPRHLVRSLSPERHKQVMTTAMENLKLKGESRPRKLFKQLRQAKLKTINLLGAEELDMAAIEKSLTDIRTINQKLAISGDAIMIEVLGQLTPEERKAASKTIQKRKTMGERKPNRH